MNSAVLVGTEESVIERLSFKMVVGYRTTVLQDGSPSLMT